MSWRVFALNIYKISNCLKTMSKDSGDSEGFQNPGSSEDLWKSERGKRYKKGQNRGLDSFL